MREIVRDIFKTLSKTPKRLNHVINVSLVAENLGLAHKANIEDAKLAGLMHDYSKHLDFTFYSKYIKRDLIKKYQNETHLYHAISAANYFLINYQIKREVYNSVYNHVYGYPNMDILTKIIYIADSIYFTGKNNTKEIYKIALKDLDKAAYLISKYNIENLKMRGLKVAKAQEMTYNYYKEVTNCKN